MSLRRALFGLGFSAALLGLLEATLTVAALLGGPDLRPPLPAPRAEVWNPLCDATAGDTTVGDGPKSLRICPRGDRTRDATFLATPDRPRIVAVGESFVHGLRLPADQAWPAALQRQLGDGIEVLNWGVCGTSSDGLEDVARAAPRAGASVALLAIGNNEYTMAPFREGVGGRWPLLTDDLLMISSRAHIYGLLRTALLRHLPPSGPQRAFSHPRQADLSRLHGRPPPGLHDHPEGVADPELTALVEQARALDERYYQRRLRRMIADLQAHGVVPVVVSLPSHLEGRPTLAGSTDEADLGWIRATTAKAKAGDPRALDELLQIQPGNAFAWHLEGQRRARAKDRPGAAAAFRRAQDLDLLADGTTRIAALARAEAARAGAPFLDLEALGEAWLGDPTPWLDRIHVSAAGAEAVAAEVARGLRAHGLAPPPAPGG